MWRLLVVLVVMVPGLGVGQIPMYEADQKRCSPKQFAEIDRVVEEYKLNYSAGRVTQKDAKKLTSQLEKCYNRRTSYNFAPPPQEVELESFEDGFKKAQQEVESIRIQDERRRFQEQQAEQLKAINRNLGSIKLEQDAEYSRRSKLVKDLNDAREYSNSKREYQEAVDDAWKDYAD